MRVAVLMGGVSEERSVSLASGIQVLGALRECGHDAIGVDTSRGVLSASEEEAVRGAGIGDPTLPSEAGDLLRTGDVAGLIRNEWVSGADLIFPALHGGSGEDGRLQALLEVAGLPFVGSGHVGCALAMDKDLSKRLLRDAGIPTPDWLTVTGPEEARALAPEALHRLGLPLIVKPPSGGSTIGLTLVHSPGELSAAVELALEYEDRVMFERYVRGREVTVGILGDRALPVGEIVPAHELFDYECKYREGMAEEIFPADLSASVARKLQDTAVMVHSALLLRDFSRIDFILDERGVPWCLEANALPGLTSNSLVPKAARAAGISFPDLCDRLVRLAARRVGILARA